MQTRNRSHHLSFLTLLLVMLVSAGVQAQEADIVAARVLIVIGDAQATDAAGEVRTLARGDALLAGETVRTGARGRTQLRFTDGARMSIRPDSELSIDDYAYEAAAPAAAARVTMKLARGGFRTITGAIADRNRAAYRVQTPFAVIGVRGTDWSAVIARVNGESNLLLGVSFGGIVAENDAGSLDMGLGAEFDFALVRSFAQPPRGLRTPPPAMGQMLSLDMGEPDADGNAPPSQDGGTDPGSRSGPNPDSASPAAGSARQGDGPAGPPAGDADAAGSPEVVIGPGGLGPSSDAPTMQIGQDGAPGADAPVFEVTQRCL